MSKNPHAVALGRKGGKAKGKPKGFCAMPKDKADAIRLKRWKKPLAVLALAMLLATPCGAVEHKRSRRWWIASIGTVIAANILDSHSSWGSLERNPMMRSRNGQFGLRGIGLKSALAAGTITAQFLIVRRHPTAARACAMGNFAAAGLLTGASIHNYRLTPGSPHRAGETPHALPTPR